MRRAAWLIGTLILGAGASLQAATIGQIDNFENGTTQGWTVSLLGSPHPAPPVNIATGGPLGAGDNYLQLTSVGGSGAGNRMLVINPAQWTGNYIAAGITSISMDVNNNGGSDLFLRLLFENPMGMPPTDVAATSSVFVPAGSGWTHISFGVAESNLTALAGSVHTVLLNTTAIRIYDSAALDFPGPAVVARLGVDNIAAAGVPEPGAWSLLGGGLAALIAAGMRRARR